MDTVIFAFKEEAQFFFSNFKPTLVESLSKRQKIYSFQYNAKDFYLLISGMGKKNVKRNVKYFLEKYPTESMLNLGTAGILNHNIPLLSVQHISNVFHKSTAYYIKLRERGQNLLTVTSPVLNKEEHKALNDTINADLVDMEAYYIAELCKEYNTSLGVVKVTTDFSNSATKEDFFNNIEPASKQLFEYFINENK